MGPKHFHKMLFIFIADHLADLDHAKNAPHPAR